MTITQSSTRLVAIVAGVAVALSLFAGAFAAAPAQAAALSQSQISAIVSLLQSFGADATTVANVTASLNGQPTSGTGTSTGTGGACPALSRSLQEGSTGADVMALQVFLNGSASTQVAVTGAGSPGLETTYFGPATMAAVEKFQTLNGVSAIGIVGPQTRAAIAAVCGHGTTGGTGGTTTPTGPGITVSAAAQPANGLAVTGASRVPFTTFTLTNNSSAAVTVNGVTVQRTGFANDAVFTGVVLLDQNGNQIGVSQTFNSNHQATIGSSGFTLNAGQSETFTVAGNMQGWNGATSLLANYSGQIASIQVVAVNSSAPVSGVLPITGASQTINSSLAIGTVTAAISSYDPNGTQNHNIGDTGVTFAGVRLTAGSAENVKLYSLSWYVNGSISPSTDLSNLMTYVNGTAYPATLDSTGRYLTSSFPGGVAINEGYTADVYLKGDITGANASGRTAEFDVNKATDIYIVGQTYGYGIVPVSGNETNTADAPLTGNHKSLFTDTQPWFQGSSISVQGGVATTITNAPSVAAQNVAINVQNQPLGGFTTNFIGEPVTVQSIVVHDAATAGVNGRDMLTNVSIVNSSGAVVAGPVNEDATGKLTFSNSITFPVGSATYTIEGTVPSTAQNSDTYQLTTTPSSSDWQNITGQTTGNNISLSSNGLVTMNTMTVRGATLGISVSASPAAQNIVSGGQNVVFANVQLDASQSGENIRINSLPLYLATGGLAGTTAGSKTSDLSGCGLWNGAVGSGTPVNYGSNIINSPYADATTSGPVPVGTYATTFTFNNPLVVSKGTVTTLTLACNVTSGVQGTFSWGIVAVANAFTGISGNTSSNTVGPSNGTAGLTISATNAGVQTAVAAGAAGSLTLVVDPSSPSYAPVAGGTAGVTVAQIKFHPSNESINLSKIGLTVTNSTVAASSGPTGGTPTKGGNLSQVYIYNGSTLLGTAIFTSAGTTATSTFNQPLLLAVNTDTVLTVKADLAGVGIGQAGGIGNTVKVDPLNAQGTGVSSGQTVNISATGSTGGVGLYKTYPTIAQQTLPGTGVAGGQLLDFSVTANASGPVGISNFNFTVSTSTLSVANIGLYGYTDSGHANSITSGATNGQIGASVSPASGTPFNIGPTTASMIEVPAGTTYYFELRGTVTGVTSSASVTTVLNADTTALSPLSGYNMQVAAASSTNKFMWSDNATTTAGLFDVDWTNGYSIPGFSASGIIQGRSQ